MARAWYPMYWSDLLADTTHLSANQLGIYIRLMGRYYTSGKPLDTDVIRLNRICIYDRNTTHEGESDIGFVLDEFFELKEGKYHHKRIDEELSKAQEKSDKARASIKRRWDNETDTNVIRSNYEGNTNVILPQPQPQYITEPNGSLLGVKEVVKNSKTLTTKPNTVQGLDSPASSIASGLFQLWREVMNHPRAKLGEKSTKLIRDRVKEGFSEDDLRLAIVGCSRTPHNMGDNQQRTVYDDFDLIFRDSAHVRRFIKNSSLPPFDRNLIGLSPTERDNALSLQKMLGNEPIIQEKEVLEVTEEDDDEPY